MIKVRKHLTDKELIIGALNADPKCQKAIFDRYSGRMLSVCIRYTRHRMEAEDILQDSFIKVYKNLKQFQHKGSFECWVRRIVINTAIKNYKKSSFQKELLGVEHAPELSSSPSIYGALNEEELLAIISKLPVGYRTVFNLYAIEGYSHREIGEMLEIQESTSRSQLVKARKMLQAKVLEMQKVAV